MRVYSYGDINNILYTFLDIKIYLFSYGDFIEKQSCHVLNRFYKR